MAKTAKFRAGVLTCGIVAAIALSFWIGLGDRQGRTPPASAPTVAPAGTESTAQSALEVLPAHQPAALFENDRPDLTAERVEIPSQPPPSNGLPFTQDPARTCRLLVTVLDPQRRPVASLLAVHLAFGSIHRPDEFTDVVPSEAGSFECEIPDGPGSIEVRSTALGVARATFARPVHGCSPVELVLVSFAAILGRVEHGGQGVAKADVCLFKETREPSDPLPYIVEGHDPPPCRQVLGALSTSEDGTFQFSVEWPGEYFIVARNTPAGACTSQPIAIERAGTAKQVALALAPASSLEVHWPGGEVRPAPRHVTLLGDNGIRAEARVDDSNDLASVDCLPAGEYLVIREGQDYSPRFGDPPAHVELDGSPSSRVRLELMDKGSTALTVSGVADEPSVRAKLYRLGRSCTLVSQSWTSSKELTLAAGGVGPHLVALIVTRRGGAGYVRVARVILVEGTNRLAFEPVELAGTLVCATDRMDIKGQCYARFGMAEAGEVIVPLHSMSHRTRPADMAERFVFTCAAAAGVCDLVHIRGGAFEVLASRVEVRAGDRTIVRLSAGSAAVR